MTLAPCVAGLALLLAGNPAAGRLEVRKVEPAFGVFWPVRKTTEYFARHDLIGFRYFIRGAATDDDNQVHIETTVKLEDAAGKLVAHGTLPPIKGVVPRGAPVLGFAALLTNGKAKPGEHTLTVTVMDRIARKQTSFSRPVAIRPVELALVLPRFYYDAESKIPATATVSAGQLLFSVVDVIGFKVEGRVHLSIKRELFEGGGHSQIFLSTAEMKQPVKGSADSVTIRHKAAFLSPGDYYYRVTVIDRLAQRTAQLEIPVKVVAP
jgi:hypothetical protein